MRRIVIYSRAKAGDMRFDPISGGRRYLRRSPSPPTRRGWSARRRWRPAGPPFAASPKGCAGTRTPSRRRSPAEVKKNVVLARPGATSRPRTCCCTRRRSASTSTTTSSDVIQAELAPHMRRYARLRKRVLGLDRLLYCDIEAPLDPGTTRRSPCRGAADHPGRPAPSWGTNTWKSCGTGADGPLDRLVRQRRARPTGAFCSRLTAPIRSS